jgi:nucleoside-diphosphate-sugar epimerase
MTAPANPLAHELDGIIESMGGLWEELRGQRGFITGGTGFFGCWLLESFAWANSKLGLGASLVVLSRDAAAFQMKAPHLAQDPGFHFINGDVVRLDHPDISRQLGVASAKFDFVIHAATDVQISRDGGDLLRLFDTIVGGTRRALQLAVEAGAKRFLLTSSGAIYGPQPPELTHLPEEHLGAPDPTAPASTYGEAKRTAELLCTLFAQRHGVNVTIARCFAFLGPYLSLSAPLAISDFIDSGLRGHRIEIRGARPTFRSYLYAADLAVWLWTILLRGRTCRPYNVGSEVSLEMQEIAAAVAAAFEPSREIHFSTPRRPGEEVSRYIPSTRRAAVELGLSERTSLTEALRRTIQWHLSRKAESPPPPVEKAAS